MTYPDRHTLVRRVNAQRVLEDILEHGPTTRVEVAERTELSKPTVNTLVAKLVEDGIVRQEGQTTGGVGRSATVYAVETRARLVAGIDLGGTKLRIAVADLDGKIIAEGVEPTDRRGGKAVLGQINRLSRQLVTETGEDWGKVAIASLSAPGVFEPDSDHMDLAFNIPGFGKLALRAELEAALRVPVAIDNDVNLAAEGERWGGMAREVDDFAFIAIGTGIGMGLVSGGQVVHGGRGAAGEIAYLPIGADPFTHPEVLERGPLEEVAAASGIVAAFHAQLDAGTNSRLDHDATVADIFAAADDDPAALAVVNQEARWLALAIAAVAAVVDPTLFVLGGGIGSNPRLAPMIRTHLKTIAPFDIDVQTSPLGERASTIGAIAAGLALAKRDLFSELGDNDG